LITLAQNAPDFDVINVLLNEGWILNPSIYGGKPLRLDNAVVYHLIKYTPEEVFELSQVEPEDQIVSVRKVEHEQVDQWIKKGYQVREIYANHTVLVKMGVAISYPSEYTRGTSK